MPALLRQWIDWANARTQEYLAGSPTVTDSEWDKVYFQIQEREKESGTIYPDSPTHSLSFVRVDSLKEVTHNHPMLSLAKTKEWNQFTEYFQDKGVILMPKMDGLTCSLQYENGKLVRAETRGNGIVGEDILHNVSVLSSIPLQIPYTQELIVDGEIICPIDIFDSEFAASYGANRNFASGSIRLLNSEECQKRKLKFVVWNVVKGFEEFSPQFHYRLEKAADCGLTIVPYATGLDLGAKEWLVERATELYYPIDGLVGRFDDVAYGESLGSTGHHAKAAYAFKFTDTTYFSTLVNIEWTMGRTGVLTPVAQFAPIEIDGTIVERASLHNYSIYKQLFPKAYIGQYVTVYKANMIIPQIQYASRDYSGATEPDFIEPPTVCPYCGTPLVKQESDSGVKNLICPNKECSNLIINRLDHFAGKKGLDIKGLSHATLEKLIAWGWIPSLSHLFCLHYHRQEWIQKKGFGPASVDKILAAIDNRAKSCELSAYIAAIGIPLIGSSAAKDLAKIFETWEDFRDSVASGFDFSVLEGFAGAKSDAILGFDYREADLTAPFLTIKNSIYHKKNGKISLENKVIVITGSLTLYPNRDALKKAIEECGGKVTSSISKRTNYLINNDINSTSSKNLSAKKFGVEIISEKDFCDKFLS